MNFYKKEMRFPPGFIYAMSGLGVGLNFHLYNFSKFCVVGNPSEYIFVGGLVGVKDGWFYIEHSRKVLASR